MTEKKAPLGASASDLWLVMVLGGAVVAWSLLMLVLRIVEIAPNENVPIDITVPAHQTELILAEGAEPVPGEVRVATVEMSDLPPAAYVSVLGSAAVQPLTIIGLAICVVLLTRNLRSGRFFSRGNTRLVTAASVIIVAGWLASLVFSTTAGNSVLALLTDHDTVSRFNVTLDWTPLLAAMAIGALAAAFHAGERMQRDTEGLI